MNTLDHQQKEKGRHKLVTKLEKTLRKKYKLKTLHHLTSPHVELDLSPLPPPPMTHCHPPLTHYDCQPT